MRGGFWFTVAAACGLMACGDVSPASFTFQSISPTAPRLGDVTTLKFLALDSRGEALSGAQVKFTIQGTGGAPGVTLSPTTTTTTKGTGIAETQVVATSHVNAVVVIATAGDKVALSPPI